MQNDVLKNQIAPYQSTGRWYQFFIESNGSELVLTTSDIEDVEIISNDLYLPEGFHIVDIKIDIHSVDGNGVVTHQTILRDGRQCINLPTPAVFDDVRVYIFGYSEGD